MCTRRAAAVIGTALVVGACGGELVKGQSPEDLLRTLSKNPQVTEEFCLLVEVVCGEDGNKGTAACKTLEDACKKPELVADAGVGVGADAAKPPSTPGVPDLVVTAISWQPKSPQAGDAVTFGATIKNVGTGPTPPGTTLGVRFSVDGTTVAWSDSEKAALAAGKSVTVTANGGPAGKSTWTATQGTVSVEAWVDDIDRIPGESDETNNTLAVKLDVASSAPPPINPPPATTSCLSPPALKNPMVFAGKCPGDSGGPHQIKPGGKDVLIKLPLDRVCDKSSNISISGAGNVHIVGGHLVHTMPDGKNGVNKMINLTGTSGTTFIEGMHIDVNNKHCDAIAAYNNKGKVIVQNSVLRGMGGAAGDTHGDAIHPQGGGPLADIIFQNVSVYTGYQGLFVVYRENGHGTRHLDLRKVNLAYDPRMPASQKPLILLYLGHENPKPSMYNTLDYLPPDGTVLDQVFIDSSLKKVAYHTRVIPNGTPGAGGCASFGSKKIQGKVCDGKPSGGDFAPQKLVGLGYDRSKLCK